MLETTKWKDKLIDLGANPFLKGLRCTIEALKLIDEEKGKKVKMMYLYEAVGKKTWNTSLNVERIIRHFLANMRKNSKGAETTGQKAFLRLASTYRNWRGSIINALSFPYSNGVTEGFNNKIKVLKRISYGLKNFEEFRKRILLICN